MPPRLQRLAISKGRNILSLSSGIEMSSKTQNLFIKQALPFAYLKHNLHSSFLVNFWEDLMNLLVAFAMAFAFLIFEKLSRALDWPIPETIFQTLRIITKWNFCIMVLMINIDDIILFSALEFRSLDFSANYSGISLTIALIFLFIILLSIPAFIYLFKKKRKNQTISQDFQVLFNGFRNNSIFSQLFFIIYIFRIGIPMLIAVCLEITPIGNTVLQILLSLAILGLLIIKKPFIKKINHYQFLLFEFLITLMNLSMFLLTILSTKNQQNSKFAILLADFVIIGNDLINLMLLVFLIIKLHIEVKLILSFIKTRKIPKYERIALWLQLLYIPLQLSHMGSEEIVAYKISQENSPNSFKKKKLGKLRSDYERHNELDDMSFDQIKQTTSAENSQRDIYQKQKLRKDENISIYNSQMTHIERLETFGEGLGGSSSVYDMNLSENNNLRKQSNFIKIVGTQDHLASENMDPFDLFCLMKEQETVGSPEIQFINNISQENANENSFHLSERVKTQNSSRVSILPENAREIAKRSFQPSLDHSLSLSQSEDIIEFSQRKIHENDSNYKTEKMKARGFENNELNEKQTRLKVVKPDEQWRLNLWKNGRKLFNLSQKT